VVLLTTLSRVSACVACSQRVVCERHLRMCLIVTLTADLLPTLPVGSAPHKTGELVRQPRTKRPGETPSDRGRRSRATHDTGAGKGGIEGPGGRGKRGKAAGCRAGSGAKPAAKEAGAQAGPKKPRRGAAGGKPSRERTRRAGPEAGSARAQAERQGAGGLTRRCTRLTRASPRCVTSREMLT